MSAERTSRRSEASTTNGPAAIQSDTFSTTGAWSPARNGMSREYAATVASPTEPAPVAAVNPLPIRGPKKRHNRNPISGSTGITQSGAAVSIVTRSPLEQVDLVDVDGFGMPEEGDEDGEADGCLRGGDGDDE